MQNEKSKKIVNKNISSNEHIFTAEEAKDLKNDIRNYKNDSLARLLTLLGLAVNCVYFITLYKANDIFYYQYPMGLSVLYNLIFMLIVFLSAENVKVYNSKFAYPLIIIGLLQVLRIFYLPKNALAASALSNTRYLILVVALIVSMALLVFAGIISIINSTKLKMYNKRKGEKTCHH